MCVLRDPLDKSFKMADRGLILTSERSLFASGRLKNIYTDAVKTEKILNLGLKNGIKPTGSKSSSQVTQ